MRSPLLCALLVSLALLQSCSATTHTTAAVKHLSPLTSFSIKHRPADHTELHPLHAFHPTHPSAVHHQEIHVNGLRQPHPKQITLEFAYDHVSHVVDLQLQDFLFAPHSYSRVWTNEQYVDVPHMLQSYMWTDKSSKQWMAATLLEDQKFHVVWHTGSDIIQIDPMEAHRSDMYHSAYQLLNADAVHGMVVFRHSDLIGRDTKECGSTGEQHVNHSVSSLNHAMHGLEHLQAGASGMARQLQQLDLWTGCYSGEETGLTVKVGVGVDWSFYALYGSTALVQSQISSLWSAVNSIYITTFNVQQVVASTEIMTTVSASEPVWNVANYGNGANQVGIGTMLDGMAGWKGSMSNTYPIWVVLTNNYPPPGVVGISYETVLCNPYWGVSICSWNSPDYWVTVAHEIGHQFGALHTWVVAGYGSPGDFGGIMDYYCDGKIACNTGTYEFYEQYTYTDVCQQISSNLNTGNCFGSPETGNLNYATAAPQVTYSWTQSGWGSCSASCGGGTQVQSVGCQSSTGTSVSTSLCSGSAPASSQTCNTNACYTVWVYSDWSACSASCGSGTQTRQYECQMNQNSNWAVIDNSVCQAADGNVGATAQACSEPTCAPAVVPSLVYGAWGDCSASCGTGTQTRSIFCVNSVDGASLSLSQCSAASTSQSCNAQACAPAEIYSWQYATGGWSQCSASCGGGVISRAVQCVDQSNNVVANSNCAYSGAMPITSEPCNTQACSSDSYVWGAGDWSSCSASCGGGLATRQVECVDYTDYLQGRYVTYGNYYCLYTGTTPNNSLPCNSQPCGSSTVSYSWQSTEWSPCTANCGDGTQTREVTCVSSTGATVAASYCGGAAAQPATFSSCNTQPCTGAYTVAANSNFTALSCSATCGGGSNTRNVSCIEMASGLVTSPDNCSGLSAVASTTSCANAACGAYWATSAWSTCSQACGITGSRTRSVECLSVSSNQPLDATQDVVGLGWCGSEPSSVTSACNPQPCPQYEWQPQAWSTCSAYCGPGTQTRSVNCVNTQWSQGPNGPISPPVSVTVDSSFCAASAEPATMQQCTASGSCGDQAQGYCTGAGQCLCAYGYTGVDCNTEVKLGNLTLNSQQFASTAASEPSIPIGESLQITWNNGDGAYASTLFPRVNVLLAHTAWAHPQYIGVNVVNSGLYTWNVATGSQVATGSPLPLAVSAMSDYTLQVYFSQDVYAVSQPFTLNDPCSYTSCGSHGTCSSGVCSCVNGWYGSQCQSDVASSALSTQLNCNPNGTASDSSPFTTNDACHCSAGWFGSQCQCRAYQVSFQISDQLPTTAAGLEQYQQTLLNDLHVAASNATAIAVDIWIVSTVAAAANSVNVTIGFAGHCIDVTNEQPIQRTQSASHHHHHRHSMSTASVHSSARAPNTASMTAWQVQNLLNAWQQMIVNLEDGDSVLYHGVITHNINTAVGFQAVDPSGLSIPAQPGPVVNPFALAINEDKTVASPSIPGVWSVPLQVGVGVGAAVCGLLLMAAAAAGIRYFKHQRSDVDGLLTEVRSIREMPPLSLRPHIRTASATELQLTGEDSVMQDRRRSVTSIVQPHAASMKEKDADLSAFGTPRRRRGTPRSRAHVVQVSEEDQPRVN